jgi:GT2 family glycosyltransferase
MLTRCVKSIAASDYPDLAVVIVDDDSGDGSSDAVAAEHPGLVALLRNAENMGYARSVNRGVQEALRKGADFVFLLNNDTVIEQRCIARLMDAATGPGGTGGVGAWGTKILNDLPDGSIWSMGERIDWRRGCWEEIREDWEGVREVEAASACALLVDRRAVESVGLLDGAFFTYGEDIDFSVRLRRRGYRIVTVPDALVWHTGGGTTGDGNSPFKLYYFTRNRLLLMKRYGSARDWAYFVPFFAYHVVRRLYFLARQGEWRKGRYLLWAVYDFLIGRTGKRSEVFSGR